MKLRDILAENSGCHPNEAPKQISPISQRPRERRAKSAKFRGAELSRLIFVTRRRRRRVPQLRTYRGVFSHVSGSWNQIRFQGTVSGSREARPGSAASDAFGQLREIELRVAATLTPPEVGVCQFVRTRIYRGPRTAEINLTAFAADDRRSYEDSSPPAPPFANISPEHLVFRGSESPASLRLYPTILWPGIFVLIPARSRG